MLQLQVEFHHWPYFHCRLVLCRNIWNRFELSNPGNWNRLAVKAWYSVKVIFTFYLFLPQELQHQHTSMRAALSMLSSLLEGHNLWFASDNQFSVWSSAVQSVAMKAYCSGRCHIIKLGNAQEVIEGLSWVGFWTVYMPILCRAYPPPPVLLQPNSLAIGRGISSWCCKVSSIIVKDAPVLKYVVRPMMTGSLKTQACLLE